MWGKEDNRRANLITYHRYMLSTCLTAVGGDLDHLTDTLLAR